jgi:hypothetical protein
MLIGDPKLLKYSLSKVSSSVKDAEIVLELHATASIAVRLFNLETVSHVLES